MRRRLPAAFALAATAAVGAVSVTAADPPPRDKPYVGEENVRVESVNLDVVVLDKKGRRVLDLGPDDFEVFEGGKRVRLDYFHVFDETAARAPATPGAGTEAAVEMPATAEQQLHLLVVFDDFFTLLKNRLRVTPSLQAFTDRVLEGDGDVMVVTAGRRLRIEQPFTADRDLVRTALARTQQAGEAETAISTSRDITEQVESTLAFQDPRSFLSLETIRVRARTTAAELEQQVRGTIEMLEACVKAVSGLPGRKIVLLVSDGFPTAPGREILLRGTFDPRLRRRGENPLLGSSQGIIQDDLTELAEIANGHRVAFYTLRSFGSDPGADTEGLPPVAGDGLVDRDLYDLLEDGNVKTPLAFLAHATGGRALVDGSDVDGYLDEVAGDLRRYYALGWTRDAPEASDYSKIKVRVRRSGVEAHYRRGHLARPAAERDADEVRSALLLGSGSNPLGIRIVTDRAIPTEGGRYKVPMLVPVPVGRLVLVPEGDQVVGGFRLVVASMGHRQREADLHDFGYSLAVPREVLDATSTHEYPAMFTLELKRGTTLVAVGLRDDHGNDLSIATIRLDIPSRSARAGP